MGGLPNKDKRRNMAEKQIIALINKLKIKGTQLKMPQQT